MTEASFKTLPRFFKNEISFTYRDLIYELNFMVEAIKRWILYEE
jgi:hypothetical protein